MSDQPVMRLATAQDADAMCAIYNGAIAERTSTFETEPRSTADFEERIADRGLPTLVATDGEGVIGWAGLSRYSARQCYAGICEASVYVAAPACGRGVGTVLADALAEAAEQGGFHKMLGKIFPENTASIRLVERCGFESVGVHRDHGRLDGQWRDVLLVERRLSPGPPDSPVTDEPIRLSPPDPDWPTRFEAERRALEAAIGEWVCGGIHHVGSTAVPGLEAKPIIDILVGIRDLESARACFAPLSELGYLYAPYRPEEMLWFCKPNPARRTHHLHLVPANSERYRDELAFRDRLRADPEVARRYAALKRELAERHRHDREAYTDAKSAFIEAVLRDS
jgi:GrpB-like predicted nucleotidyltransferase (UPF0157 family)/L-amino acid N-acyltransferase YncA